jgi:hypothetical protein
MKWLKKLFAKSKIQHVSFHTGTSGMKNHNEFIIWVNSENVKIINSFIQYHSYDNSHKPAYINYVIKYKKI